MIGDSNTDIQAVENANIDVILSMETRYFSKIKNNSRKIWLIDNYIKCLIILKFFIRRSIDYETAHYQLKNIFGNTIIFTFKENIISFF